VGVSFVVGVARLLFVDPKIPVSVKAINIFMKLYVWWSGSYEGGKFNRQRADFGKFPTFEGEVKDNVLIKDITVPSHLDNEPIPVTLISPFPHDQNKDSIKLPILFFFHGGGFVYGTGKRSIDILTKIAKEIGSLVLSVDYRRSPEHPFPLPVEDCFSVLRWISTAQGQQKLRETSLYPVFDLHRVVLSGESAGANLAAVVSIMARDRSKELPGVKIVQQALIYPCIQPHFTEQTYTTDSSRIYANGYLLNLPTMVWLWKQYIPPSKREEYKTNPSINPFIADREGLPPALILTAQLDPLRDEGVQYHQFLLEGNVPSKHREWDGAVHGFFSLYWLPESKEAHAWVIENLRNTLNSSS